MLRQRAVSSVLCCSKGWAQPSEGIDLGSLDRSVRPCDDFYRYCGKWLGNHPIPKDEFSWGRFSEMKERTQAVLRQILEEARQAPTGVPPYIQELGDYIRRLIRKDPN